MEFATWRQMAFLPRDSDEMNIVSSERIFHRNLVRWMIFHFKQVTYSFSNSSYFYAVTVRKLLGASFTQLLTTV